MTVNKEVHKKWRGQPMPNSIEPAIHRLIPGTAKSASRSRPGGQILQQRLILRRITQQSPTDIP